MFGLFFAGFVGARCIIRRGVRTDLRLHLRVEPTVLNPLLGTVAVMARRAVG